MNAFDAIVGLFFLSVFHNTITRVFINFLLHIQQACNYKKWRRYRRRVCDRQFGWTTVVDQCFPRTNILNTSYRLGWDRFWLKKIFRWYNHVCTVEFWMGDYDDIIYIYIWYFWNYQTVTTAAAANRCLKLKIINRGCCGYSLHPPSVTLHPTTIVTPMCEGINSDCSTRRGLNRVNISKRRRDEKKSPR